MANISHSTFLSRFALVFALAATLAACTATRPPGAYMPSREGIVAGKSVTVEPGQNVYAIAQKYNVSMRELIVLNDLKPPYTIKSGQSLTLPASGGSVNSSGPVPSPAPRDEVEKRDLAPITPAPVSQEVLSPPPVSSSPAASSSYSSSSSIPLSQPAPQAVAKPSAAQQIVDPVHALNQPAPAQQKVATTATSAASASASSSTLDMKWPVQGTILSGFGAKGSGLSNDGVNIGAPKGAPVVAAAGGTVVYAGNEMKGFGNLVLIRHQDDWVTAYAHLDRVLVKKDSVVAKGDMIGTIGKTGDVSSPQLHFETRHNGKPVDPSGVVQND